MKPSDLSTPKQLDKVELLARREGLLKAANVIARERKRLYPVRDWELGACVWCEVIDGKRRKATLYDAGGGPPTCEKHADPDNFPGPPPEEWAAPSEEGAEVFPGTEAP